MGTAELSKWTTVNIQEKANLIWAIADKLVGTYKPHEYGNVILPMCVIKRFSDTLAPTKEKVLQMNDISNGTVVRHHLPAGSYIAIIQNNFLSLQSQIIVQ